MIKNRDGVITVYLSIITLLMISVTMVCLESARVAVIGTCVDRYSDMAAEMVFSGYVKPLADRYGIFVLDAGDEAGTCDWFEKFLKMNLEENSDNAKRAFSIYGKVKETSLNKKIRLSDSNWDILLNQVKRSTLYKLGEDGLKKSVSSLKKTDTSDADEKKDEIIEDIKEKSSDAQEAEEAEKEKEEEEKSGGNSENDSENNSGRGSDSDSDKTSSKNSDKDSGGSSGKNSSDSDDSSGEEKIDDPRPGIGSWIKGGILKSAMGDKSVSSRKIDVSDCSYKTGTSGSAKIMSNFEDSDSITDSLNDSETKKLFENDTDSLSASDMLSNSLSSESKKALLNIYILNNFRNLRTKSSEKTDASVLSYEIEYILFGHKSDKENLESTVSSIFALRTALNLAYLYTNQDMTAQAGKAVTSIATSALPAVGTLIQLLLLSCWAGAESMVDCAALVNGKKVPMWKSESTWNLTFSQMTAIAAKGGNAKNYIRNGKSGLTYKQYLSILLGTASKKKKIVRMLQLMEKNIRLESGYSDFKFKNCLAGASFSVTAGLDAKFYRHPSDLTCTCTAQYIY